MRKTKNWIAMVLCLLLVAVAMCVPQVSGIKIMANAAGDEFGSLDNNIGIADSIAKGFDPFTKQVFSETKLEDDFADDSIIIVLDEKVSQFRTDSKSKFSKSDLKNSRAFADSSVSRILADIETTTITDLTAFPDNFLDEDGKLSTKNAKALAEHFETTPFRQILHIELAEKSKQNVLDIIAKIEKRSDVLYVGANQSISPATSNPNDPYFRNGTQWHLNGTYGINAPAAWDITTGSSNVRVGIMDTGIAIHDDLNTNLTSGWDFYNNNAITTDVLHPHGTSVAGIIGAVSDNNFLGAGISHQVTLVPMQISYNANGSAYPATAVSAINYARNLWGTSNQISILNYSYSGFGTSVDLLAAIQQFPGLFVWSAGNNGDNLTQANFPNINSFKLPNIISVGAHDKYGARSVWTSTQSSSYGSTSVDIFAPGGKGTAQNNENCLTTGLNNSYSYFNGTSSAAPMVTGVAALIKSQFPGMTAAQIKAAIMAGVDTGSNLNGLCVSGGRLNAYKALQEAASYYIHGAGANSTVSGDFNGDGYDDIAMFMQKGNLAEIHTWSSDGSAFSYEGICWSELTSNFGYDAMIGRIIAGDFNGDGKCDIAAFYNHGNGNSSMLIWYETSSGFALFGSASNHSFQSTLVTGRMVAGDFNGDGYSDIAALRDNGNGISEMLIWYGQSAGLYYYGSASYHTSFGASAVTGRMVAGDFNGDGRCDVAALYDYGGTTSGLLLWYGISAGLGYYGIANWHTGVTASAVTGRMVAGDFNGDGSCDIAGLYDNGNGSANMLLWCGQSTALGYYGIATQHQEFGSASAVAGRMVAGDFNGDGYFDIAAFYNYSTNARMLMWSGTNLSPTIHYYGIIW